MLIHRISTIMLFYEISHFLILSFIFKKNNRNSFFYFNSFIRNSKALIFIDMIIFIYLKIFFSFCSIIFHFYYFILVQVI